MLPTLTPKRLANRETIQVLSNLNHNRAIDKVWQAARGAVRFQGTSGTFKVRYPPVFQKSLLPAYFQNKNPIPARHNHGPDGPMTAPTPEVPIKLDFTEP